MKTGANRVAALAALMAISWAASAEANPRGCIITDPANIEFANPCTYHSLDDNGIYAGSGNWELRIRRDGQTVVVSSANGDPITGSLRNGDVVTGQALSKGSTISFGNPRPDAPDEPSGMEPLPAGYRTVAGNVTSFDGTRIAYTLYLPAAAGGSNPVPAVIFNDHWGGDGTASDPAFSNVTRHLLATDYAVLAYTQRGRGTSGGTVELDSYDYEARDVSALIDMLAARDDIEHDGPGDPRVGTIGASYGGPIQLTAAARDHRIDAIEPDDGWSDVVDAFLPQGVFKLDWMDGLGVAGTKYEYVDSPEGTSRPVNPPLVARMMAEGTATGDWSPDLRNELHSRAPMKVLDRITAPTLILSGEQDTLFQPDEPVAVYKGLRAAHPTLPVRLFFYTGGHGYDANEGEATDYSAVMYAWLDRWLKHDTSVADLPAFTYYTQDQVRHESPAFPPPHHAVSASSAGGLVVVNGEPQTAGGFDPVSALVPNPLPVYTPTSPLGRRQQPGVTTLKVPIPAAELGSHVIAGAPTVTVSWTGVGAASDDTGHAPLFFRIVDLRTDTVVDGQETPRALATDGKHHTVTFALESIEWQARPSDRLALEISSGSSNYEPYRGAAAFLIDGVRVSVPVVAS